MLNEPLDVRNELRMEKLCVRFAGASPTEVLGAVSLSVSMGEKVCVVGPSGGGKSTLLRAAIGLLPETAEISGSVALPGGFTWRHTSHRDATAYRRSFIGSVFQDAVGSLVPGVSIGVQAERVFRVRRSLDTRSARKLAAEAIEQVGLGPADRVWRKCPEQISGGMAQRVNIALGLLAAPGPLRLITADEPISSLDSIAAAAVLDLVLRLAERDNAATLFVTHDVRLARHFDRVAVLDRGRIMESRESEEFLREPASASGRALREASIMLGEPSVRLQATDSTRSST